MIFSPFSLFRKFRFHHCVTFSGILISAFFISGCSDESNIIKDEDNRYRGGGKDNKPIQVVISEQKDSKTSKKAEGLAKVWQWLFSNQEKSDSKTYVKAEGLARAKNVTGGKIYGNYNKKGKISGAVVTMESGHVNFLEGGYGEKDETSENRVKVLSGKLDGTMVDGDKYAVIGGYNKDGIARGNTIEIIDGVFIGDVDGGVSKNGSAIGNFIYFNGGNLKGDLDGGYAKQGISEGNTVEFNGGILKEGEICGGSSDTAAVKNNNVVVRGEKSVINGRVIGGSNDNGEVSGNSVTILGGVFKDYILGGASEGGTVTGNSIYIKGKADISEATLIAGYSKKNTVSGNMIQAEGMGFTTKNIVNADKLRLILPQDIKNGSTVFTLTMKDGTDLGNPAISMNFDKNMVPLAVGDEITIASNKNGIKINEEALAKKICGVQGNLQYEFLLIKKDGSVIAKIERKGEKICTPED